MGLATGYGQGNVTRYEDITAVTQTCLAYFSLKKYRDFHIICFETYSYNKYWFTEGSNVIIPKRVHMIFANPIACFAYN